MLDPLRSLGRIHPFTIAKDQLEGLISLGSHTALVTKHEPAKPACQGWAVRLSVGLRRCAKRCNSHSLGGFLCFPTPTFSSYRSAFASPRPHSASLARNTKRCNSAIQTVTCWRLSHRECGASSDAQFAVQESVGTAGCPRFAARCWWLIWAAIGSAVPLVLRCDSRLAHNVLAEAELRHHRDSHRVAGAIQRVGEEVIACEISRRA